MLEHSSEMLPNQGQSQLTDFELERLQRIQRNKQVLAEMGLEDAAEKLAAEVAARKASKRRRGGRQGSRDKAAPQELARRSKRIACQPAEVISAAGVLGELSCSSSSNSQQKQQRQQQRQRSQAALSQLEPSSHHNHNLRRIRSMSQQALKARAWKIRNVGKLISFVKVLEAEGMEEVLQEARAALEDLLANPGSG